MENYIISLVDTENTLGKTHPTQRENGQPNFSISIQSDIVHQKKNKNPTAWAALTDIGLSEGNQTVRTSHLYSELTFI